MLKKIKKSDVIGNEVQMKFAFIFLLSAGLIYIYRIIAIKHDIVDTPNHRSSHSETIPRGAGIVFVLLWLFGVMLALAKNDISGPLAFSILYPVSFIAVVSFLDDYYDIPRTVRLLIHLIASTIAVISILGYEFSSYTYFNAFLLILLVLTSAWSVNLYNFMDGLDGLAAIQAIFIFSVSGLCLYIHEDTELGYLSLLLAFSVMGFLIWNWPKAKIFMGDVGSTTLGILIIIFACWGYKKGSLSPLIYFIMYLPFLFDATITVFRRMLYGEKWYYAHKSHAFQRLHSAGWSHQNVLFAFIGLCLLDSFFALIAFKYPSSFLCVLLMELLLILGIYISIERIYPMMRKSVI